MTRVLLLRHGQTDNQDHVFNGPTHPLTETGRRQVPRIAHDLSTHHLIPQVIFCSPYQRTHETALIIAKGLGLADPILDTRLEEWRVGPWFERSIDEFYAATAYGNDPPRSPLPPELESLEETAKRIHTVIREKISLFPGKTILLVSHREPLASAILRLTNQPLSQIHHVHLPVATLWELAFDEQENLTSCQQRFDHSQSV